jgi:hypothetical protein
MVQSLHKAEVRPILGETDCRIRQLAVCIFYGAISNSSLASESHSSAHLSPTIRRALCALFYSGKATNALKVATENPKEPLSSPRARLGSR